jgi:ATP-dependent RNA helicase RhlE
MDKKITVLEVKKADYSETLALTEDVNDNWRKLIADTEKENQQYKGKKKKKK